MTTKTTNPKKQKWQNILACIWEGRANLRAHFRELLTDDEQRVRVQFFAVFLIFTVVSGIMTVINLITAEWQHLMYATLAFTVLSLFNAVLMLFSRATEILSRYLFAVEITVLFAFFIISGEPQGFSAIWIILMPSCGLLLYRFKYGTIISFVNFLMLIFFFWTNVGHSFLRYYGYSESFRLRFPFLYLAALAVGTFFELIRVTTQSELSETRKNYEHLSRHDPLTGLYNRNGFYTRLEKMGLQLQNGGSAFALIDLDNFKSINDRYGHLCGDFVLKEIANIILTSVDDSVRVCRWGGDEMAVFFSDPASAASFCEQILQNVRAHDFCFGEQVFHCTLSIGLITAAPEDGCSFHELISAVDSNLYLSKRKGKDCLVVSSYADFLKQSTEQPAN